jgi:hypothetical protein
LSTTHSRLGSAGRGYPEPPAIGCSRSRREDESPEAIFDWGIEDTFWEHSECRIVPTIATVRGGPSLVRPDWVRRQPCTRKIVSEVSIYGGACPARTNGWSPGVPTRCVIAAAIPRRGTRCDCVHEHWSDSVGGGVRQRRHCVRSREQRNSPAIKRDCPRRPVRGRACPGLLVECAERRRTRP